VARQGTDNRRQRSAEGRAKLDAKLAREAGIPDDLPPAEYAARLKAARSAWGLRMAQARWTKRRPKR
jgi:hypothetical protein